VGCLCFLQDQWHKAETLTTTTDVSVWFTPFANVAGEDVGWSLQATQVFKLMLVILTCNPVKVQKRLEYNKFLRYLRQTAVRVKYVNDSPHLEVFVFFFYLLSV
jgi:hypothetical protein